jgi:hypothetical protein
LGNTPKNGIFLLFSGQLQNSEGRAALAILGQICRSKYV